MTTMPEWGKREEATLTAIREALAKPEVSIRLVHTFNQGRGAQVYLKSRKIGPILLPAEGQTLGDVLHLIGSLIDEGVDA